MLTPSLSITDQLLISLSRKSIMMQAAALSLQLFVIAVALQCCLLPNRQAVAAQEQNDVAAAAAAATTQRYSAEPRHGGSLVPPPRGHSCMATSSRPVHRLKVEGKVFCLRLPRVLKNPPVDVTGTKKFVRTYNDTCGLYGVVFSTFVPAGAGPPPHVHFAGTYVLDTTDILPHQFSNSLSTTIAVRYNENLAGCGPSSGGHFTVAC
jgi:hypothetical protein